MRAATRASRRRAATCRSASPTPGSLPLDENRGFAGGTNAAIAASRSPWILTLNPDAEPEPDYLARLLARAGTSAEPPPGALTGRLLRRRAAEEPLRLDACGMRLAPAWRHFDRGAGEIDRGQYGVAERVFGATGAASLWRRAALEDVAVDGEWFDERFHSYREDAELCFRLRERGWEILYEPSARAVHGRRVLPERRRALPAAVNLHSLKNRYLLRCGHQSAANLLRTLPWTLPRDLGALALGAGGRARLARRLRLALAPPQGDPRSPATAARAADRAAGGGRTLVRDHRRAAVSRPLRVALIGSRGIPGRYGGFETFAEELAPRLVARGYEVTVYGRSHYVRPALAPLSRRAPGGAAGAAHASTSRRRSTRFLSCLHAAAERYDAVLVVQRRQRRSSCRSSRWPASRRRSTSTASRSGGKWGPFGRAVYALSRAAGGAAPRRLW